MEKESLDNLADYMIDIVKNRKIEMAQNTSQQTIGNEVGGLRTTNFECKGTQVDCELQISNAKELR